MLWSLTAPRGTERCYNGAYVSVLSGAEQTYAVGHAKSAVSSHHVLCRHVVADISKGPIRLIHLLQLQSH